jgi:hypothetical protein
MKYLSILTVAVLLVGGMPFCNQLDAQTNARTGNAAQQAQHQVTPATLAAAPLKKLGFRLTEWKTIHAHSAEEAETAIGTLKKLGCEVASDNHGNHIDVQYRCSEWKSIRLATDQLVNQWSTWCASKGMETVVVNPPANTRNATVKFRLATPKTVHLHDANEAKQILNTLQLIDCQVSTNDHGNHVDATFSSPNWITLELPSDENAHAWESWLRESGFETEHAH